MKFKTPCFDCLDRTVGCHGKCKIYNEFRNSLTELNETKHKEKEVIRNADSCLYSITKRRMYKGW